MILDSSFLIDFFKGKDAAVTFYEKHKDKTLFTTTTISIFEIMAGIKDKEHNLIIKALNTIQTYGFSKQDAFIAGNIFNTLKKSGETIDPHDCMIAAIAITQKSPLVTNNVKHFSKIPKLKIVTYSE